MSVSEYYACYLYEVQSVIDAFYELESQRQAAEWQRTRIISFFAVKPHDIKRKIKKPADLFKLASDNENNGQKLSKKYIQKRIATDLAIQQKQIEKWKREGILN